MADLPDLGPSDLWAVPASGLLARLETGQAELTSAVAATRLATCGLNDAQHWKPA